MTKDGQLKPDEILIRGLVRLPSDLDGEFGRLHQDKGDFVRKANYRKTGKPENGISVFRRSNYPTNQEFYARVNIRLPMGASECALDKITAKGMNPSSTTKKRTIFHCGALIVTWRSCPIFVSQNPAAVFQIAHYLTRQIPLALTSPSKK